MTDLAEIRARCEAATPGPWIREGAVISSLRGVWYALKTSADRADLSLMFRACEDIPALLAEVERLMNALPRCQPRCPRCTILTPNGELCDECEWELEHGGRYQYVDELTGEVR
jgi:hypothetical protein